MVYDYIDKKPYLPPAAKSRPLGKYLVSGYSNDFQASDLIFEYGHGAFSLKREKFAAMPKEIEKQGISLWNVALEIHTGRIFENILRGFYILIVHITGLSLMFILISGFILWYQLHRKEEI